MNLHFRAQSAEGYEINRTSTKYAEQKKTENTFEEESKQKILTCSLVN